MNELRSILLAEDNPNDVELTLAAFSEHNLANEVFVVSDGEEAIDYLFRRGRYKERAGGNPAIVLLDLKMPKVDGLEVLRAIKQDEKLKSIPVVMLTSSREESDLLRSYELGVNSYVEAGRFSILHGCGQATRGVLGPVQRTAARQPADQALKRVFDLEHINH